MAGYFATLFGWTNTRGIVDTQRQSFLENGKVEPSWSKGEEWKTFEAAAAKDKADVDHAAELSGIPSDLIIANLAVEQLRLFYSNRELFKTVFAPLKILGDQSQFSWGVMGIKQDTARAIETHLTDTASPFYIGTSCEHLLDFKTTDRDAERFARITDEQSRFYSYLYAGLYLRQIIEQWKRAGYDIGDKPDILGTLYNIGFEHSQPKANPEVGGAAIDIDGVTYSFGRLVGDVYAFIGGR